MMFQLSDFKVKNNFSIALIGIEKYLISAYRSESKMNKRRKGRGIGNTQLLQVRRRIDEDEIRRKKREQFLKKKRSSVKHVLLF